MKAVMKLTNANSFRLLLLMMIACVAILAIAQNRQIAFAAYRTRIKDPGVIRAYLNANPVRKLQLGAGGFHPAGWLNTDTRPIPIPRRILPIYFCGTRDRAC